MNDRCKFRVWNKELNKFDDSFELFINQKGILKRIYADKHINYNEFDCDTDENYVVQQCTGVIDTNGNLIYEGDYIKEKEYKDNDPMLVEYMEMSHCCCCGDLGIGFNLDTVPKNNQADSVIIVGNIFENPEFLGDKK